MIDMPLWAKNPHILRWLKLLLEFGLAEDGEEAEAIFRNSPWYPMPEDDERPRDMEFIAWARRQRVIQKEARA
jgi:hypothetical protein